MITLPQRVKTLGDTSRPGGLAVTNVLPSWKAGATRDAVLAFLDASMALPVGARVAAFDNDGTLWSERPFVQLAFFESELRAAVATDPSLSARPEYAALLEGDHAAMGELGLERIALALVELFDGQSPAEFDQRARSFMAAAQHPSLEMPLRRTVYQPMLELLDELRRREFSVFIVSGGGTEFVRAVSQDLYRVPPECVVGTLVQYDVVRGEDGVPRPVRTARLQGAANEGPAKIANIQTQLGRQPILAVGNSGGDRDMLEWALDSTGPSLALVVDHDDAEREFAYASVAQTFAESEPIIAVAERLGWTVISMARDWSTVFPPPDPGLTA
jgi:phosphoserine phosphatase